MNTIVINKPQSDGFPENFFGAFELKKFYTRNYTIGLVVAVLLHILGVGLYYFIQSINKNEEESAPVVRIMKYSELGPPPSIANEVPPQIAVSGPVAKPTVGVPVPVPDEKAPAEQTIATQEEMSQMSSPTIGNGTGNVTTQITQDIKIEKDEDKEPDINAFVPYEKGPEIVVAAKPVYPEIAQRAGISGKVYVKVLVDKEGKPKKAVVIKTDAEIFNQAAIDAAMKSVFTPALQNQHPITVWVVIPFKFELNK
ncbi:TonB family protein [Melioribacteraceae bacterium 4301-Me]|uniref:TonB family protein n=1 Tax=Pyranulibacter aquaticus TaxID=3163344 RepID=UPI003595FEDE